MKYLLAIAAISGIFVTVLVIAFMIATIWPVKAGHVPLIVEKDYTDYVTVCKKEKFMEFIDDIIQISESEQNILQAHGCYFEQKSFIVEGYVCSFVVKHVKTFSVIKIDDRIDTYVIVQINPVNDLIECTSERIDSFPIRIPAME